MRCVACNKPLSDLDTSRKFADSQRYVDMCSECSSWLPPDLNTTVDPILEQEELVFSVDEELASIDAESNFGMYDDDETNYG